MPPRVLPGALLVAVLLALCGYQGIDDVAAAPKCEHTVAKGDTLSGIAARYGVTERGLAEANPALAKNPNLLRIGQVLDICGASSDAGSRKRRTTSRRRRCGKGGQLTDHTVKKGETLSRIARRYATSEKAVQKRNSNLNPDLLRVGQVLEICAEPSRLTKSKLCDYATPIFEHTIVPGEHIGQIAGRYGVRRRDVVRWNSRLSDPNRLRVGQRLRICPEIAPRERTKIRYAVTQGDTIGSIAKRYGLTSGELTRYQQGNLKDPNSLRIGQQLVVWVDGDVVVGFGGRDTDKGTLKGGIMLPPGRHYHVKWKAAAWGTAKAVRSIQAAVASYKRKLPGGPKVHVGDISKRAGGKFPPHLSHQHGRDVDIGYVLKGPLANETRFRSANAKNLDVPRTWALVKAFIDTNQVTYIFMDYRIQKLLFDYGKSRGVSEDTLDELFQYPRGRGRSHGIIRHWRGHVNHFHVRFRK